MVNPINKNDPEEEIKRVNEQKRRAPPAKDFNEALEQVDPRRQQPQDDGMNQEFKTAKKPVPATFNKKEVSTAPLMSPFDLASRGAKKMDEEIEEMIFPRAEDIAEVPLPKLVKNAPAHHEDSLTMNEAPPSKKPSTFEAVEQHDIDIINPQGYVPTYVAPAAPTIALQPVENKAPIPMPRPLHEIMNDIVKQIDVLKVDGKTETTIDLKGAFNQSRLIITQFDSDKNAMNITIDNLTAANQQIVDAHKVTLIKNLEDINIHVHIFTASTTIESNTINIAKSDTGQPGSEKERNLRDNRRQNQQQG